MKVTKTKKHEKRIIGEQKGWDKIVVPSDPVLVKSVPSPAQLIYQTNQYGAFLHYGPAVFMDGNFLVTPDPKVFNPTQLDAEQWVLVAKSFGAKHLVFSAKHHNGFCNWPTKTTDYSVLSSPWRNGQGDLVREVADACRKHGIALGIYYSGRDHKFPCYEEWDRRSDLAEANREAYWPVYRQQIEELITNYGDIACLWLDVCQCPFEFLPVNPATGRYYPEGVIDPKTGKSLCSKPINPKTGKPYGEEIYAMVKAKQPNCAIYQGARPEINTGDNEAGTAPYPLWNVVRRGEGWQVYLSPLVEGWVIQEAINCRGTFSWVPVTPEKLMEEYYVSVGRGANFLQALVPDKRGLIDDTQAKVVAEFGAELRRRFGQSIARTDSSKGWLEPGVLEIDLGGARKIVHVVLEEEIAKGQHVLKYAVDVLAGGTWKTVAEGQSIGRKRIERFEPSITAERVRFRVVQANAIPSISAMMVYDK